KVKEKVLHYQMLISDEVHILGAKSCYKLTKYFKNAFYRYGFSATPLYRDEALLVEAAIGPVLYEKSIKDISGQYIADAKIVFVPFRHLPASKYLTYTDVYREKVVFNEERNKVIANLAARFKDKKTLIAVRQVEHGKVLEEMIPGAKFVYGNLSAAQRVKILNEFENGSLQTVIITCVWEQGIDIPQAEVLIDARAEKSKLAFIQLIGRVLRKTTNKHKSLIIDIADERVRWLSQHTKERIDIAIKEFGKEAVFKLKNERQN
ncbi:MAG: helicase-related protein, partial [Candidatus Micrarchaeia archaeon]